MWNFYEFSEQWQCHSLNLVSFSIINWAFIEKRKCKWNCSKWRVNPTIATWVMFGVLTIRFQMLKCKFIYQKFLLFIIIFIVEMKDTMPFFLVYLFSTLFSDFILDTIKFICKITSIVFFLFACCLHVLQFSLNSILLSMLIPVRFLFNFTYTPLTKVSGLIFSAGWYWPLLK